MIMALDLAITIALVLVALIDARKLIIPDSLSILIAGMAAFAAYLGGEERMLDSGLGGLMAFALFQGTRQVMSWRLKREAMGFGDVKFMTAGAIWVGAQSLPLAILAGCLAAAIGFVVLGLIRRVPIREHMMPFGPFLAFGLVVAHYADAILLWVSRAT